MANKILFIGVGSAGSIMADKAMNYYPELFESVVVDCGINRDLSCYQLRLMDRHPYDESAGFTTVKENVETLVNENINEIKYIFDRYQNDSLNDIGIICHRIKEENEGGSYISKTLIIGSNYENDNQIDNSRSINPPVKLMW